MKIKQLAKLLILSYVMFCDIVDDSQCSICDTSQHPDKQTNLSKCFVAFSLLSPMMCSVILADAHSGKHDEIKAER